MTRGLAAVLLRDLRLAWRAGGSFGIAVLFLLALVVTVPFGVGPDPKLLAVIGAPILWIGALLASLLGLDRLFAPDHEDGSLDLFLLAPVPLSLIAVAKGLAHWFATGLPLVVAAPALGLLLGLSGKTLLVVTLTLLVGTLGLTFLGLAGAALAVILPRAGVLVAVLLVPLSIPILIFGSAASRAALEGASFGAPLRVLIALSLFAAVLGPIAAATALRHARD